MRKKRKALAWGAQRRKWTGARIRQLREDMGLTQEGFAERIRTTWRSIYRWERGENLPNGIATFALDVTEQRHNEGKAIGI